MFKKMMASIIIAATFNTYATAPVNVTSQLKRAYTELNFGLEVEWDQQDKKFYNKKLNEFKASLEKLQKQGLTNEELLEFAKQNVKDNKLASDLDGLFTTVKANKMSSSETRNFVTEHMAKNFASQGANWAGDTLFTSLTIAFVVAIVIVAAASSPSTGYYDDYYYDCYDEYACYDYWDSWGGYWYEDCYYDTYCY